MAKGKKSKEGSCPVDSIDRILEKGVVLDATIRVTLVGVELLTLEARVATASVATYLKYAEATGLTAAAAVPA